MHANASGHVNLDYEQIAKEILEHAEEIDAAEDEQLGSAAETSFLRSCRRGLDVRPARTRVIAWTPSARPRRGRSHGLAPRGCRTQGTAWRKIRESNAAYEAYRARGVKNGRRFGGPPNPYVASAVPDGSGRLPGVQ